MAKSLEQLVAEKNKVTPLEDLIAKRNTMKGLEATNQMSVLTDVASNDFRDDELAKEVFDFGPGAIT